MIFVGILLLCSLAFWISAGKMAIKNDNSYYFLHLLGAIVLVVLLLLIFGEIANDCHGFLCGLGPLLVWLLVSTGIVFFWSVGLVIYYQRKYDNKDGKRKRFW